MADLKSPPSRGKRTVIRRFVPERLADFDEQVWPVNIAILVFAGFVTGIVLATTPDFFDPRPLYNGLVRLGIIAGLVLLLLWSTAHVRAPTARRIQFCVVLSLFLHLLVAVLLREQYLKLIAFIRENSLPAESETEETITLPEYGIDSVEEANQLSEYTRPVQALPRDNVAADQLIDRPRPGSPAPLSAPQEMPDLSREQSSPLVPPRAEETVREQSSDSELSAPRRTMPAPGEITHLAPLDAPPERSSVEPEVSPRDQVQREQAAATLKRPEEAPDQSTNPHVSLPARVTAERMPATSPPLSRPQQREVSREQLLASQSPSITVPEPQGTSSPGELRSSEIVPRRSQTVAAPAQASGEPQPVTPAELAVIHPAPRPERMTRPEMAVGPVGTRQTARSGLETSSIAGIGENAELQSIPQTAGAPRLARSPEEPAIGGPARERTTISSPATAGSMGNITDIVNAAPAGMAASRRPRSGDSSDFMGVTGTGEPGASSPRQGPPGEILGSVAALTPTEPQPSGAGGSNLRGAATRLEPRATGIGPAPISVGLARQEPGVGNSGSGETGGGLASELTGGMGLASSGPARGLGAAREEGGVEGQAFSMGNTRPGNRGLGEASSPPIANQAALEGTVSGTSAGPTAGGTPSDRPSATALTYGRGTSRQALPSLAGFGSGSSAPAGTSDLAGMKGDTVPSVSGSLPPRLFDRTAAGGNWGSSGNPGGSVRSSATLRGQENAPYITSQAPIAAETGGTGQASQSLARAEIGRQAGDEPRRVVELPPLTAGAGRGGSPSGDLLNDGLTLPVRRGGGEMSRPEIVGPGGARLASRSALGVASPEVLRGAAETEPAEAFAQRNPEIRGARAMEFGGSSETERAVEKGLEFLARIQFPDGHWSLHRLPDHVPDPQKTFHTGTMHGDTAATGLALLAFLGAGYTHQGSRYRDTVGRALRWLVENQSSDGRFFRDQTDSNLYTRFYGHGLATIAICEAYGMTRDPALRQPAERAIGFIVQSQNPELGGWRYESRKETDTSVSGWQLMALKSAQMAGLQVPTTTLEGVSRWLDLAQAEGGARYVYSPYVASTSASHLKAPSRAMTAEGLLMRIYLGWGPENPALQRGADFVVQNLPSYGNAENPLRDAYYWYYATQVMFQMQGEHWKTWNQAIQQLLPREQVQSGPWAGSWDPLRSVPDRWGKEAGRLYVTAMHLLILEVYYRHLPLFRTLAQTD